MGRDNTDLLRTQLGYRRTQTPSVYNTRVPISIWKKQTQ